MHKQILDKTLSIIYPRIYLKDYLSVLMCENGFCVRSRGVNLG